MEGMTPQVGQVVTVFRSRLRRDAPGYADDAARISDLARAMPGYVEHKGFTAPDGERLTLVTFADRASHDAWRDHPEHRAAMRRGVGDYYEEYSVVVGETHRSSSFSRA
jgi:heme-degrading monooxygenase HmoA